MVEFWPSIPDDGALDWSLATLPTAEVGLTGGQLQTQTGLKPQGSPRLWTSGSSRALSPGPALKAALFQSHLPPR